MSFIIKTLKFILSTFILLALGTVVLVVGYNYAHKEVEATIAQEEAKEEQVTAGVAEQPCSNVSPRKVGHVLNVGTDATEIQRDQLEAQLKGQIVCWALVVYEVRPVDDNTVRIITAGGTMLTEDAGAFITVSIKDAAVREYVYALKTGSRIQVKAQVAGFSLRSVDLEHAVLQDVSGAQEGYVMPLENTRADDAS